jgi:hypothetical protein
LRSNSIHRNPTIMTGIFIPPNRWRLDESSLYFRISKKIQKRMLLSFQRPPGLSEDDNAAS